MRNKLLAGLLITLFFISMIPLLPANFHIPKAFASTGILQITSSNGVMTFPSNVGNNHIIILLVQEMVCDTSVPTVTSIVDNQSNSYTLLASHSQQIVNTHFGGCTLNKVGILNNAYYTKTSGVTHLKINVTLAVTGGYNGNTAIETNASTIALKNTAFGTYNNETGCAANCNVAIDSALTPIATSDLLVASSNYFFSSLNPLSIEANYVSQLENHQFTSMYRNGFPGLTSALVVVPATIYFYNVLLIDLQLVGFVTTTSTVSVTATITSISVAATATLTAYNTPNGVNWILLLFGLMFLPMTLWGVYAKFRGRGSSITFLTIFSLMLGALVLTIAEFNTPSPFVPLGIAVFYIAAFLVYIINSRRKGMPPTI